MSSHQILLRLAKRSGSAHASRLRERVESGLAGVANEIQPSQQNTKWHRFMWSGVGLVVGFFGVVNLASIAAQHGFVWHDLLRDEIDEYRKTIFPIYDFVLAPLSRLFHFRLSIIAHDLITAAVLSFGAANAESMLRDSRPLFRSLLSIAAVPFLVLRSNSNKKLSQDEENIQIHERLAQIPSFVVRHAPRIKDYLYPVIIIGLFGNVVVYVAMVWILLPQGLWNALPSTVFTRWLEWGTSHPWYWPVGFILFFFASKTVRARFRIPRPLFLMQILLGILFFAAGMYVLIPPFLDGAVLIFSILLFTFCELVAALGVISPFIAWRTCLTTLAVFSILVAANWAVVHGMI